MDKECSPSHGRGDPSNYVPLAILTQRRAKENFRARAVKLNQKWGLPPESAGLFRSARSLHQAQGHCPWWAPHLRGHGAVQRRRGQAQSQRERVTLGARME